MSMLLAEVTKVVSIFSLAWFSFWTAIPAGMVLGIAPLVIIVVTSLSYVSGILIVLVPGERIQAWVQRRFAGKFNQAPDENSLLMRVWRKYGVIGFGLLAPMTVGAQLGAIIGLALNIPPKRLFVWMTIGVIAWAIGLTLLAVAGVDIAASL